MALKGVGWMVSNSSRRRWETTSWNASKGTNYYGNCGAILLIAIALKIPQCFFPRHPRRAIREANDDMDLIDNKMWLHCIANCKVRVEMVVQWVTYVNWPRGIAWTSIQIEWMRRKIYGWAIDQCGQVSVNNCAVVERLEIITRWFSDLTMESGEEDSIGSS